MFDVSVLLDPVIDTFARGGGGGSGGGGGGGGSGGGSGGSLIVAIGYIPTYYTTTFLNKRAPKVVTITAGTVVGLVVTIIMSLVNGWIGFGVFIGACIGVFSGLNNLHGRIAKKVKSSKKSLQLAASTDPAWQEESIKPRIAAIFTMFQKDWSTFNTASMQTYMAPAYFAHVELMMKALKQMGRQNLVADPKLIEYEILEVRDEANDDHDHFTAYIKASANDQLIDVSSNEIIYNDTSAFEEYWRFDRKDNEWVLEGIDQATANTFSANTASSTFAAQHNMFYSLDWGWLLLPKRGQLFGKANFKNSDVNNHVIGEWEGLLVQLYTYIPLKNNANAQNHLIAQINLPKSYGGIIVKRRSKWQIFNFAPSGYQKVSLEWQDFNKRYNVYATDMDKVTSFELLNPSFMAELHDKNLPVNIEVVDNVVYLYAIVTNAATKYEPMMEILQRSFRELKR